jgi:outer membrane protein assembly factor BamB
MQKVMKFAPYAVVTLLVLWWFGAFSFLTPKEGAVPDGATDPATQPGVADATPTVPVNTEPWSTFHGDSALTGVTAVDFPDAPTRVWHYQGTAEVTGTPVSDGERIFVSAGRGEVIALDQAGEKIWNQMLIREVRDDGTEVPERVDAPIATFGGYVLVGTVSGTLYALSAEDGEAAWTYAVGGAVLGTPNRSPVAPDVLFVLGQDDGSLHAVDLTTGNGLWKSESTDRCDGSVAVADGTIVFGSCASAYHVFSAEDGSHLRDIVLGEDAQVAGGVALVDGGVYSGSHGGEVFYANAIQGELGWKNQDSEDEVFTTPAVRDNWVVYGSLDGGVYGLDRKTGEQRWRFETDGAPTSAVIAGDKVVVGADGTVYLLRLDSGEKLWSYEVSDEITSPAIVGDLFVVGGDDGSVTAFGAVG